MMLKEYLNKAIQAHKAGNIEQAVQLYRKILSQDINNIDACRLLGMIYTQTGEILQAIELFEIAVKIRPDIAQLHNHLGDVYTQVGDSDKAIASYQKSLELCPDAPQILNNLADLYKAKNNFIKSVSLLQKAILIQPKLAELHFNLGNLFRLLQNSDEAINCYKQAISFKPDFAQAFNNLGNQYKIEKQFKKAIDCYQKAINLIKNYADPYFNLGSLLEEQGDKWQALKTYEFAYQIEPENLDIAMAYCHLCQEFCDWRVVQQVADKIIELIRGFEIKENISLGSPFRFISISDELNLYFKVSTQLANTIEKKVLSQSSPYTEYKKAGRKIKIGYLSGDFYDHAVMQLMHGVFRYHNKKEYEIYFYSYSPNDESSYQKELKGFCDRFEEIINLTDAEAAELIHKQEINILIDLSGHTRGNRMGICALRPAPVMMTYLGYPGSSGANFFDYIICDRVVLPKHHAPFYSEKPLYLTGTYLATDNKQKISSDVYSKKQFSLPENGFVFCSFNQSYKFDMKRFGVWMNILKRIPDSVLWMKLGHSVTRHNLQREAVASGIDPARLIFAEKLPKKEQHLRRLQLADLVLDTDLYNGHTSTVDALWAGVPVLTKIGQHFASTVSASLLSAIELPELIVNNIEEYEELAVKLASDETFLHGIKEKLTRNITTTRLFNSVEHTRQLEGLYKAVVI